MVVGVGDWEGSDGRVEAVEVEGDGLSLGDGGGAAVAVAVGDAPGPGIEPESDRDEGDGGTEVGVGDASGTLARTSSGSAPSRAGVSYENSPLANPAAATTATAAPVTTSRAVRRRRRGGSSARGDGGGSGGGYGVPFPESASRTAASRMVAAASGGTVRKRMVAGEDSFATRSTYGRIRRGSKSSAAAASAVRASRRASDARLVQAQDGVPSGVRGAAHSGQTCPFGSVTRWVPPPETRPLGTPEVIHIHHTFSQEPPESLLPHLLQASTGHNRPYRPPWRVTRPQGFMGGPHDGRDTR